MNYPLSDRLLREARWVGRDRYATRPEHLAELEKLLEFLQSQNRLDSFLPRLTSPRTAQRDEALEEIRVARFMTVRDFPVVEWEPPGAGNSFGEFSVEAGASQPMFVEVKSPGWENQLSQEQRLAGRTQHEKYQDLIGGPDDPWRPIRLSINKAYPKFLPNRANLLVIADDRFVSLPSWGTLPADQALFIKSTALDGEVGYFTTSRFENLGGVALFQAEFEVLRGLQYTFLLFPNPMALEASALPIHFIKAFLKTETARTC
jgi:hypothetical protein